jgi:NAD(P)-dependent dehydrogenase (short-subunit alcohol dehydrogenase family)
MTNANNENGPRVGPVTGAAGTIGSAVVSRLTSDGWRVAGVDLEIMNDMKPEWIEKEKDIPLKRLGTVAEISATAVLLASDGGNFYCGQILSPNGGALFF